jgi:hypothetical protein
LDRADPAPAAHPAEPPIVQPLRGKRTPTLGPVVLMVSSESDRLRLTRRLELTEADSRPLYISRLYADRDRRAGFAICGPVVGAAYAVMLLETLRAWGATTVVYMGWCGAIDPRLGIGDVLVPTAAFIDEGTSRHYGAQPGGLARPAGVVAAALARRVRRHLGRCHRGAVWSTDAIFRETPSLVRHYQRQGAVAVEMETSALFSAAGLHRLQAGALLVVSDELSRLSWRPGFKDPRFTRRREALIQVLPQLCHLL